MTPFSTSTKNPTNITTTSTNFEAEDITVGTYFKFRRKNCNKRKPHLYASRANQYFC